MKPHPALSDEHEQFRDTVRHFAAREIAPHGNEWDEAVQTLGGAEEIMKDLAAKQLGW